MNGSMECGGGRRRSRGFRPQGWLGGSGGRDEVGRVQAKDLGCRGSEAKSRGEEKGDCLEWGECGSGEGVVGE